MKNDYCPVAPAREKWRPISVVPSLVFVALFSASLFGAEQQRIVEEVPLPEAQTLTPEEKAGDEQALTGKDVVTETETVTDNNAIHSTHATQEASTELLLRAAREPQAFVGKRLVLVDGPEVTKVGPVTALRKRIDDQELYLVVDAQEYFNSPTLYAIAVRDVERMEGDRLVIPEAPGMHLRGRQYYADDYTDKLTTQ